jgi:hypothetical protein
MRWLALLALASGCGAPPVDRSDLAAARADLTMPAMIDAAVEAADLAAGCTRTPGEPDRARRVVVSHPFGQPAGTKAKLFEVLDLGATGTLAKTGVTFSMGTALSAPIRFTPDGAIGLVAQDDGSIGVFRFDGAGMPVVVHAAFKGGFYAGDVIVDGDGARAWVLDANTDNNGGGVYEIGIACDGKIEARGRVVAGGRANAMDFVPGTKRALLATGGSAKIIDFAGAPMVAASGDAFPDQDAIPSSAAVMPDGKYALVADNGFGAGSRVAAVALPAVKRVLLLVTPNPAGVVASPFGNAALILNSDGKDALRVVKYDPANANAPFAITGEVAYRNGKPQLPSAAVMITRGTLRGRVLVAENTAVRQVRFTDQGAVEDVALTSFGPGIPSIVGTVGVQP